jgi:hypothetical protein
MATIPTVQVLIRTAQITGTGLPLARVVFNFSRPDIVVGSDGAVVPASQVIVTCDENGDGEGDFFPNVLGTNRTQYGIQIYDQYGAQVFPDREGTSALTSIPNVPTVLLHSVLYNVPTLTEAETDAYLAASQAAAGRAEAAELGARAAEDNAAASMVAAAQGAAAATAEGNVQAARVLAEGDTQSARVLTEGNTQTTRVVDEGTAQAALLVGQVDLAAGFATQASGFATQASSSAGTAATAATDAGDAAAEVQALVAPVGDLTTAVTQAQTARTGAESARDTAAQSALDAQVAAREYATLAAALADAAITNGMRFTVRGLMAGYFSAYQMERTATGHKFLGMRLSGLKAALLTTQRALRGTITPNVMGALSDCWGSDAWEWDGRLVPNRQATTPPTLNMLADPFNPLDEIGTTPTREPSTAAVLDPMGTSYALKLTHTAQLQFLTWYNPGAFPAGYSADIRFRIKTQNISGTNLYRVGEASASGALVTAPAGAWDATAWERTIVGYTGTVAVGFGSNTANTTGVVAIANAQMYDPLAGESSQLPTDAQELAAQKAGHMKRNASTPGIFPLNADGTITMDPVAFGSAMVTLDPAGVTLQNGYWFGGFFEATQEQAGSTGAVCMGFDKHTGITNGVAGNLHGQLGVYQDAASAYRIGKIFANPTVGKLAGSPAPMQYMVNQGLRHMALSMQPNGDGLTATETLWLDGVPSIMSSTIAWSTAAPMRVSRLQIGAWNNTDERRKVSNPWVGKFTGTYFYNRAPTAGEMVQRDRFMIEQLRLDGGQEGPRKMFVLHNGDSLTAFSPSWAWHLSDHRGISPRYIASNVAMGGTDIGGAIDDARRLRDLAQIRAARNAGFQKVVCVMRLLTNELAGTDPWSWIANGRSHAIWRDDYLLPLLAEYKAIDPDVVDVWYVIGPPRINLGANLNDELLNDLMIQAANDDFRDNWQAYGLDKIIDLGLGTERLTDIVGGVGTFAAETRPGGDFMMNWRCVCAASATGVVGGAAPHAVTGALTLSALSGAAVTATSDPGTFLWHDMYRKITATGAPGYGRIFAINGDGSQATIDTRDVIPTAWPGEPATVTTRDRILRGGGFNATNYAVGQWSIVACQEEWLNDGIHESEHGGRREADRAAPIFQAFQNGLPAAAALR